MTWRERSGCGRPASRWLAASAVGKLVAAVAENPRDAGFGAFSHQNLFPRDANFPAKNRP